MSYTINANYPVDHLHSTWYQPPLRSSRTPLPNSPSAPMAPSSIHSDNSSDDGSFVAPAPATVIQTISIRHHVPVTLDMHEGNYG